MLGALDSAARRPASRLHARREEPDPHHRKCDVACKSGPSRREHADLLVAASLEALPLRIHGLTVGIAGAGLRARLARALVADEVLFARETARALVVAIAGLTELAAGAVCGTADGDSDERDDDEDERATNSHRPFIPMRFTRCQTRSNGLKLRGMLATQVRQKDSVFYFAAYPSEDLLDKVRFISRFYTDGDKIAAEEVEDADEVGKFIAKIGRAHV